jgi:hypothetical protein
MSTHVNKTGQIFVLQPKKTSKRAILSLPYTRQAHPNDAKVHPNCAEICTFDQDMSQNAPIK